MYSNLCNPSSISPAIHLLTNICKQSQLDESAPLSLDLPLFSSPPPTSKNDKTHSSTIHKSLLHKQPSVFSPQIQQWEQNLERFNMDLFRMRCYLASLQGGELPNPKSLLAFASRPTKTTLGRLGIFSVSSFHALVRE